MAQSDGMGAVGKEIASALDAAVAEAEAMQLDMLPGLAGTGRLPIETKDEIRAAVKRRPGRPAGAKNLVTRDMLEFVRRVFGDPVEGRARWLMYEPEQLAKVLGCTTAEAFDRQDRIRADLQRLYYAPKAPVDDDGKAVPWLTFQFGGQGAVSPGAPANDRPPWEYDFDAHAETQQNQALLEPAGTQSHDVRSHDGEDASNISGLAGSSR